MATVATKSASAQPNELSNYRVLTDEPNALLRAHLLAFLLGEGLDVIQSGEAICIRYGAPDNAYSLMSAFRWGWRRCHDEQRTRLNELTA